MFKRSTPFILIMAAFLFTSTPSYPEIVSAIYKTKDSEIHVNLVEIKDVIKSSSTLNFPQIIDFGGPVKALAHGQGAHYGGETRIVRLSKDDGKTWNSVSRTKPLGDDIQNSGLFGRLSNGSVIYINAMPKEYRPYRAGKKKLKNRQLKEEFFISDPTFRLRVFGKKASVIADTNMKITETPWDKARYELYGSIVQLDNGNYIAPFQVMTELPQKLDLPKPRMAYGYMQYKWTTAIGVSKDNCRTFQITNVLDPTDEKGNIIGESGLAEPDLIKLENGTLLCVMRTGWASTMYQSISKDNGKTWTTPTNVGWPGVRPRLRQLSNGVLVCSTGRGPFGNIYNKDIICPGHPQSTFILINPDGTGQNWLSPFYFYTGPGCSYTSNLEEEGKLKVYFSSSSFGKPAGTYGLPYQSIKCAVIDIRRN